MISCLAGLISASVLAEDHTRQLPGILLLGRCATLRTQIRYSWTSNRLPYYYVRTNPTRGYSQIEEAPHAPQIYVRGRLSISRYHFLPHTDASLSARVHGRWPRSCPYLQGSPAVPLRCSVGECGRHHGRRGSSRESVVANRICTRVGPGTGDCRATSLSTWTGTGPVEMQGEAARIVVVQYVCAPHA